MQAVRYDSPEVDALIDEWQEELLAVDPSFATAVGTPIAADDFAPPQGVFLLLRDDGGAPLGCAGLRPLDAETGEVKRLFVRRSARGRGTGSMLLRELERQARERGYARLRLDTGGDAAALALFRSAGFVEIADYNGNRRARHWFEKRI